MLVFFKNIWTHYKTYLHLPDVDHFILQISPFEKLLSTIKKFFMLNHQSTCNNQPMLKKLFLSTNREYSHNKQLVTKPNRLIYLFATTILNTYVSEKVLIFLSSRTFETLLSDIYLEAVSCILRKLVFAPT